VSGTLDSGVLYMVRGHSGHQQVREDRSEVSEFRRHGEVYSGFAQEFTDLARKLSWSVRFADSSLVIVWLVRASCRHLLMT
jgi:hypothetical protein